MRLKLHELLIPNGFWYLASTYTSHPNGLEVAFEQACEAAAVLVANRIPVFCPIAHSHPVADTGLVPADSHVIWLWADMPFLEAAHGMLQLMLPGWQESKGMAWEIAQMERMRKPIVNLDPRDVGINTGDARWKRE